MALNNVAEPKRREEELKRTGGVDPSVHAEAGSFTEMGTLGEIFKMCVFRKYEVGDAFQSPSLDGGNCTLELKHGEESG